MSLISIIIPYYKKKEFLKKSLNSVLEQTYKNFEIIIIYDDEDQRDLFFLRTLIKRHKRIRLIINKKNLGAGLSRNKAIKMSKGKYVAFIDADDIWEKKKLEYQICFMRKNKFRITHTDYKIVDENENFLSLRKARDFMNYQSLLKSCNIGLSTVVLEKKILKNNLKFPKLKTKEDFVLWLLLLKDKNSIMSLNLSLTKWKKVKYSLSSSIFQKLTDGFKVYNYYMKFNKLKSTYLLICLCFNYLKK